LQAELRSTKRPFQRGAAALVASAPTGR